MDYLLIALLDLESGKQITMFTTVRALDVPDALTKSKAIFDEAAKKRAYRVIEVKIKEALSVGA